MRSSPQQAPLPLRFLVGLCVALAPWFANVQTLPGNPLVGRQLAERWCASCHLVSPLPVGPVGDGAKPFQSIADRPSTTPLSLRAFWQTPHGQMPDLHISRREGDDLIGFILSLRRL